MMSTRNFAFLAWAMVAVSPLLAVVLRVCSDVNGWMTSLVLMVIIPVMSLLHAMMAVLFQSMRVKPDTIIMISYFTWWIVSSIVVGTFPDVIHSGSRKAHIAYSWLPPETAFDTSAIISMLLAIVALLSASAGLLRIAFMSASNEVLHMAAPAR